MQLLTAPDNMLAGVLALFASARRSINLEIYQLEQPDVVATLAARAKVGVLVDVLLEGGPTGGLTDETRWAAQQLVEAGATVRFMVSDVGDTRQRYSNVHAKFAVVDGSTLLVGTENFTTASLPADASDGDTRGRRGYAVILTDPVLVARAQRIFAADSDASRGDIFPWQPDHPQYGPPPPGYLPPTPANLSGYQVRHPDAAIISDADDAWLYSSPEASLTPGPLLDLIASAGAGDVILVQQLYEQPFWGAANSNPTLSPNPRLEALIAAARRGASVRLLLDKFFDVGSDARSNRATVRYVTDLAQAEGLDMQARLGNPAGLGLHAKLHLLAIGSERWVVVSSVNGSEVSNKLNRELGVALRSPAAFAHLADTFWADWEGGS